MAYKVVNLEQGSDEWLKKRTTLVTGTDVAKILRSESARVDLACAKEEERRTPQTRSMKDGHRFEPVALKWLSKKVSKVFSPVVIEDTSLPLMVSLDGADFSMLTTVEIKTPDDGKESKTWKNAERGVVDEDYYIQIQAGLLVSGARECFYVVYDKRAHNGIYLRVKPDLEMFERIKKAVVPFYDEYLSDEAGTKKRPINMDSDEFHELSLRYKLLKEQEADLKDEMNLLKEKMLEMVYGDGVYKNEHVVISVEPKKSTIDKDLAIKTLLGNIDLERFRKPVNEGDKDVTIRVVKSKPKAVNNAA